MAAVGARKRIYRGKDEYMDYILAGIAAVLLFGYLIYALLKPERF